MYNYVVEAQMGATPFFLVSLLLVVGSGIFCVVGNLQGNCKTLVAAILSITAGMYSSLFSATVYFKFR